MLWYLCEHGIFNTKYIFLEMLKFLEFIFFKLQKKCQGKLLNIHHKKIEMKNSKMVNYLIAKILQYLESNCLNF